MNLCAGGLGAWAVAGVLHVVDVCCGSQSFLMRYRESFITPGMHVRAHDGAVRCQPESFHDGGVPSACRRADGSAVGGPGWAYGEWGRPPS